jgi:hypothetical protein
MSKLAGIERFTTLCSASTFQWCSQLDSSVHVGVVVVGWLCPLQTSSTTPSEEMDKHLERLADALVRSCFSPLAVHRHPHHDRSMLPNSIFHSVGCVSLPTSRRSLVSCGQPDHRGQCGGYSHGVRGVRACARGCRRLPALNWSKPALCGSTKLIKLREQTSATHCSPNRSVVMVVVWWCRRVARGTRCHPARFR